MLQLKSPNFHINLINLNWIIRINQKNNKCISWMVFSVTQRFETLRHSTNLSGGTEMTGVFFSTKFTVNYVEYSHVSRCPAPSVTNEMRKVRGLTPALSMGDLFERHLIHDSRTSARHQPLNGKMFVFLN